MKALLNKIDKLQASKPNASRLERSAICRRISNLKRALVCLQNDKDFARDVTKQAKFDKEHGKRYILRLQREKGAIK